MNAQVNRLRAPAFDAAAHEADLVRNARDGNELAVRELIRRMNPRLFRVARGIVGGDAEAEDVVQETYVTAFGKLESFRAEASFATWITRIAINIAKMRLRRERQNEVYDTVTEDQSPHILAFPGQGSEPAEVILGRTQISAIIEKAVADLPPDLRVVFLLRETEGLTTAEVATTLEINPITVKTRLYRARRRLKTALEVQVSGGFETIFPFDGLRCVRMADRVIAALKDQKRL